MITDTFTHCNYSNYFKSQW